MVSVSISRLCEFLLVLVHGFHYLSDCSPSPCISSLNFAVCPTNLRDFGLSFPPRDEQPAPTSTTASCKRFYRSTGTTACTKRYYRPVWTVLLRFSFRLIPLLFGCSFLGDFCLDIKIPQSYALRHHHRDFQAIPLTPLPVARNRITLQRYTLQPC